MKTWRRVGVCLAGILALGAPAARAQETFTLEEQFGTGGQHHVQMRVELSGSLTPPAPKGKQSQTVKVEGSSSIDYDERALAADKGKVSKTVRVCERLEFRRTIGGQPQELALRPGARRLVILRKGHTEVPFSPDGPLTWGEIDAVRTDVFVPALLGLLPQRTVAVGERWQADEAAVRELTDLEKIDAGGLECRLERLVNVGRKRLARVTFTGTVKGVSEDGPVRHRLQGHCHFDLQARFLTDVTLLGTTLMVDPDGKEVGKIDGRLVLTRSAAVRPEELSDRALDGVKLEPNDENTLLLYDNADLGVKFLHPRRWRVAQVMGAQVALATNDGNGILITVDPLDRVPAASAFLDESKGWLTKQKAKLVRTYTPRRMRDRPTLDAFALEAEMGKERVWMDYYVTAQGGGGATVAARLGTEGLAELRREVEKVARSVTITKRIVARPVTPAKGR